MLDQAQGLRALAHRSRTCILPSQAVAAAGPAARLLVAAGPPEARLPLAAAMHHAAGSLVVIDAGSPRLPAIRGPRVLRPADIARCEAALQAVAGTLDQQSATVLVYAGLDAVGAAVECAAAAGQLACICAPSPRSLARAYLLMKAACRREPAVELSLAVRGAALPATCAARRLQEMARRFLNRDLRLLGIAHPRALPEAGDGWPQIAGTMMRDPPGGRRPRAVLRALRVCLAASQSRPVPILRTQKSRAWLQPD